MADPRFFEFRGGIRLGALADFCGGTLPADASPDLEIDEAAPLEEVGPSGVSYIEGKRYRNAYAETRARACFVPADLDLEDRAPETIRIIVPNPKAAFAETLNRLFKPVGGLDALPPTPAIAPDAVIGDNVAFGPGVVIGPRAEIGAGSRIGPNAVVGPGVVMGRDCVIGAQVTLQYALLGDRVMIHPNTAIGQDGFGYVFNGGVHQKIPQVGRVVLQDDVEIGSCTTVDRGAIGDTIIAEGAKIDNLVQVAHNCRIGRGCIVVGQVGLSGSTVLEDFVVLGGQVGCAGHLTIGAGSQVAARSGVPKDLPAGGIYGGAPARPVNEWRREIAFLSRIAKGKGGTSAG